ncbi:TniQ family protein [Paucibacter sp. B2R-40]|uniref:TniQ family protein n=1 Tax=Paucibacter sp. B2R-40 TaxID=2893554 RepID=UPI0021E3999F|nr:TniQ family protein [Paucibacter sp. B2R-40]MCV2353163.1 TniQ family protein [Paucibacter sp. B2R-40]
MPCHPQRQPDELLSSWIVALARANGCKVHTFCSKLSGNQHTIWNRDIDRMAPPELLGRLEELTGIDAAKIRTFTLAHLAEQIDVDHHANGNATWILPLGVWHRKRLRYGVQFCPMCLGFDKRPYVRRSWRLAYYTECEHHRVLLMDRCQSCGEAFNYFRGELGNRNQIDAAKLNFCVNCGFDLWRAVQQRFEWPDWQLTVAIRTLQFMTDFGWATLDNRTFTPAYELLLVIRQLIRVMSSGSRGGQLYDTVAMHLWPEGYQVLSERGKEYERRGVIERHRLFGMAVWLLMDWPGRFELAFHSAHIRRYSLTRDMKVVPAWYAEQCAKVWQL